MLRGTGVGTKAVGQHLQSLFNKAVSEGAPQLKIGLTAEDVIGGHVWSDAGWRVDSADRGIVSASLKELVNNWIDENGAKDVDDAQLAESIDALEEAYSAFTKNGLLGPVRAAIESLIQLHMSPDAEKSASDIFKEKIITGVMYNGEFRLDEADLANPVENEQVKEFMRRYESKTGETFDIAALVENTPEGES
jgi:hypothetical protein